MRQWAAQEWKRARNSPTFWVALALFALGGWAVYIGRHDKLREWAPNIAVAAFGFAITITAIDALIRQRAQRRAAPRVENAIYWIGLSLRGFISAVITDYALAHAASFREIPADARDVFRQWLDDQDSEDVEREPMKDGRYMLVASGQELGHRLEEQRNRDVDVLEPELVRAIEDFQRAVGGAVQLCGFAKEGPSADRKHTESVAFRSVAEGGSAFAVVFAKYDASWMTVLPLMKAAAAETSTRQRASGQ